MKEIRAGKARIISLGRIQGYGKTKFQQQRKGRVLLVLNLDIVLELWFCPGGKSQARDSDRWFKDQMFTKSIQKMLDSGET